jgi:hypothetical protein
VEGGSWFWALSSGESSDGEEDGDNRSSSEAEVDGKFFRDAVHPGFSVHKI